MPNQHQKTTHTTTTLLLLLLLTITQTNCTQAAPNPINTTLLTNKAIRGYDPVAYHTQNKALKGNKKHTTKWNGANWHFTTQQNLKTFQTNPKKYAPAYGGYCAWAAAHNKLIKANPKIFNIHQNKLYLNYDKKTQNQWNTNLQQLLPQANKNYPNLTKKQPTPPQ